MGLIQAGIPLRQANLPHGRQSQPRFGQRRLRGTVVELGLEQRLIDGISQMREQGLSLRQIAANLSAMGVGTKANGRRWHPNMVKRILDAKPVEEGVQI